jgi:hypothetical protein
MGHPEFCLALLCASFSCGVFGLLPVDVAALIFGHEVSLASCSPREKITTDVTDKERIKTDRAIEPGWCVPRFYFPY